MSEPGGARRPLGDLNTNTGADLSVKSVPTDLFKQRLQQPQKLDAARYHDFIKRHIYPTEREIYGWKVVEESQLCRIDICALAYAASEALAKDQPPTVQYLVSGSSNRIFLLIFPDGTEVIARVPLRSCRIPGKLSSVVATMTFANCCLSIPCPKVYSWNDSDETIVGAPYILMEKAPGIVPWKLQNWATDEKKQRKVLDNLAHIHAKLARRLPFEGIGNIYFSNNLDGKIAYSSFSNYRVGSFIRGPNPSIDSLNCDPTSGPHASLKELWEESISAEITASLKRWPQGPETVIDPDKWELRSFLLFRESSSFSDVLNASQHLRALASSCVLPNSQDLLLPCLVPSDFAYRNLLVDPETLEVTLVDWDDVSVMPFVLCTRVPDELCCCGYATETWTESTGMFSFLPYDGPPPPDLPPEHAEDARLRERRLYYKDRLGVYDERFSRPELWASHGDPLKITYLATHGWAHWLAHGYWLEDITDKDVEVSSEV